MSRVRGFAPWNPKPESERLVYDVAGVIDDMRDYLPLTLRQIFYRLVVADRIEKTEKGYARLCEVCNRGRRGGWLKFEDIRDDGTTIKPGHDFNDEAHLTWNIKVMRTEARMDLQSYQARRLWVWCEAQGMLPQLERVASEYGVSVISSGGFDSTTTKHEMATTLEGCLVLHLGDYDPSGVHIFSSLAEDIREFGSRSIDFIRLAVTPQQRDEYDLPTAPPKKTDRRSFDDTSTVQCEALSPPDLANILRDAILSYTDPDALEAALKWQQSIRDAS